MEFQARPSAPTSIFTDGETRKISGKKRDEMENKNRDDENDDDNDERKPRWDVVPLVNQHLDTHECQDDRQSLFEITESSMSIGKQEIQGPKAKDGKRIRRKNDELLSTHRQNSRHRVNREQHISEFDEHQNCKKWRC